MTEAKLNITVEELAGWLVSKATGKQVDHVTPADLDRADISFEEARAIARRMLAADALVEHLRTMTFYLIESHQAELEDGHYGDSEEPGEDPEGCSYCREIAAARTLLAEAGLDVAALTPQADGT